MEKHKHIIYAATFGFLFSAIIANSVRWASITAVFCGVCVGFLPDAYNHWRGLVKRDCSCQKDRELNQ